jgi:hypothetical protein
MAKGLEETARFDFEQMRRAYWTEEKKTRHNRLTKSLKDLK